MIEWGPRHDLAAKRLRSVLQKHIAACDRILEQKISDAGPTPQRVDPHILTEARKKLMNSGIVSTQVPTNTPWYYLSTADPAIVGRRISELDNLHQQTQKPEFVKLLGQTMEIAVFRALKLQKGLHYFGHFADLDDHDDDRLYSKEEPPSSLSGRTIPNGKKLDFLVQHPVAGYAGIEVKNVRQWLYPGRDEIRELLLKCCALDVVPVLVARRLAYVTFSVLNPCGVILHQTFNQLYPASANDLATKVKAKLTLGYHDIRIGNEPDTRLKRFVHENLPKVLPEARKRFEGHRDLLEKYANGEISYTEFAEKVRRRSRGEPEDLPEDEDDDVIFNFDLDRNDPDSNQEPEQEEPEWVEPSEDYDPD